MMKIGMLEAGRPGRAGRIRTGVRTFALLILGCSAASAAALVYPAKTPTAGVMRVAPVQVSVAPTSAKAETRLASASEGWTSPPSSEAAPTRAPVRQIPLIAGVDPTPPTPPKVSSPRVASVATPAVSQAQSAPVQATPPAPTVIAASAKALTDCLPEGLKTVLQEVQAHFGTVTLVSTRELHTDNHSPRTARHKMHTACKAVDFKVEGDLTAVTAYLRTRPEVSGVNSYRNNRVIHIDAAEGRKLAQR
jgi:peptidase M15-like protein